MSEYLQKIGRFAFKNPWKVVSFWLVMLALLGFATSQFYKVPSSAITIPGTEAQVAIDRASELFPDGGKGSGRIVFQTKGDDKIVNHKDVIEDLVNDVSKVEGVTGAVSPFVSTDFISKSGTIAYTQIQLNEGTGMVDEKTLNQVASKVESARSNDLQIEIGGELINQVPSEILGVGEVVGVVIALLVLLMTLGSLISAGMPIATALIAVGVSTAGLFSLSQVVDISSTTPVLGIMLGLAVGIDYSLFIISKYRLYALAGYSYKDAAVRALGTAGNAVVFAAMTVIIALAALAVVQIPFMTTMGFAGASSIAIAALVTITLAPALLNLAGGRVFGKKLRAKADAAQARGPKKLQEVSHNTIWYRWGEALVKRPVLALVTGIVIVGLIAWPAKDLELGLPIDQYAAAESTQHKAYKIIEEGFGAGYNGPLMIVAENLPKVSDADKQVVREQAMAEFEAQVAKASAEQQAYFEQKAASITSLEDQYALQQEIMQAQAAGEQQKQAALTQIEATVSEYAKYVQLNKLAGEIAKQDDVVKVQPALVLDDGTAGVIQVIPSSAPGDDATTELINSLRDPSTQSKLTSHSGVKIAVTGATALQNDINAKLTAALPQYLGVVVGLSLILLMLAFRSVLVPIKATLGFLLSVAAMFGALVAVFQWGWFGIAEAQGPIVSFIPIIATGILFGLAMDYEFFLVSGMHESYAHSKNKDAKKAVARGFGAGSKVVTAAGVIMVSVFAGFVTNHDATIQAIGFGLAIGILIDAFIVRMTIVPAVMTLLGKSAWWLPKWIDRWLPRVSVEGDEK